MKSFLVKKTFGLRVKDKFLRSEQRDKLTESLYALGANKVKRVGSSHNQILYISFIEDYRSDSEIQFSIDIIYNKYLLDFNHKD